MYSKIQKKEQVCPNKKNKRMRKTLKIITMIFLFLCLDIISVRASIYSRDAKVSINLQNKTISEALSAIATKEKMGTDTQQQQSIPVTGTVTDEKGDPLPGVNIIIKGKAEGVVSDIDGKYLITVSDRNAVLVYSFVGFETQEITVEDRRVINIALIESSQKIDEVVIVGYGTQKKATLTGAVSSIKNEEITTTKNENIQNMLTGKVAGLRVVQNSSEPGQFSNYMDIRGFGAPLIVVDGVPRANMQRLDPEDIESISILKDASAAIYGLRAGNGVVLITTKQGNKGTASINYSGNMTWQVPSNYPDMVDAVGWMTLFNERDMHSNIDNPVKTYTQEQIDEYRNGTKQSTDWRDAVLRKSAPQTQHNLNVSGGNDAVTYFVSFGHQYQGSFLKTDAINYKKYNLRSNLTANLNKNLKLDLNLSALMDERKQSAYDMIWIVSSMWRMRPMTPVWYNEEEGIYCSSHQAGLFNPVAVVNPDVSGNRSNKSRWLQSSAALTYTVPFVKGLSLKGFYSYDNIINDNKDFIKSYTTKYYLTDAATVWNMTNNKPYNVARYYYDKHHTLWNVSASYTNSFDRHNVSGMILFENTYNKGDNFYGQRQVMLPVAEVFAGESENQLFTQDSGSGALYEYSYQGLVGRLNYDFDSKYIVELLARYESSSKFSSEMRRALFPSVLLAYRISEENFWKNSPLKFINNFKIRGSYGKMGDDSAQEYQFITGYYYPASSGSPASLPKGSIFDDKFITSSQEKGISNKNLTWFDLETTNLGIDAEAWYGLLGVTAEIFQRTRNGELATRAEVLPGIVGASLPQENLNSSRIRGFELDLSHRNVIGEVRYQIRGNVSYSKHQYLHRERAKDGNSFTNWRNNTNDRYSGIWWGYGSNGRVTNWDQIYHNPTYIARNTILGDYLYEDWNKDGMINDLDVHPLVNNSTAPLINYGITLSADWKGIDFTMLWQGTSSRYTSYTEMLSTPLWADTGTLSQFLNRWHPEDPEASPYDPATRWIESYYAYTGSIPNTNSMFNMQNAAYIRLKNLEIGYTLPKKWLSAAKVQNIRIYASGYNLLTFTKLKYLDPEFPSSVYNYPLNKTFTVGLNVKF